MEALSAKLQIIISLRDQVLYSCDPDCQCALVSGPGPKKSLNHTHFLYADVSLTLSSCLYSYVYIQLQLFYKHLKFEKK